MLLDDIQGTLWMDGELQVWQKARVHILTHGLHYASSVFEGERSYNGRIFKLQEHTDRLLNSAKRLGMQVPYSQCELEKASIAVLEENRILEGYIRPLIWRGSESLQIGPAYTSIHVAIIAFPWTFPEHDNVVKNGVSLMMSPWRRPPPETAPWDTKAAGLYTTSTLGRQLASDKGFDDALMLDWRGRVAEATGANIFLVINGTLHTPVADCFLDGITRRTVIELARAKNIQVIERAIMPEELSTADEIFMTGTAAEITPIRQIEDIYYSVGPITKLMIKNYAEVVRMKPQEYLKMTA